MKNGFGDYSEEKYEINTAVKEHLVLVYIISAVLFLIGMFLHGIYEINKGAE